MPSLRDRFAAGRGYLAACTLGLPADVTRDARARATSSAGRPGTAGASEYSAALERARGHAATLLGVEPERIATGSQVSVFAALAAASAPAGAEVVCVDGDFSSVVAPFLARGDLRVRHVPLAELADAIGPDTWMVVVLARAVGDGRGRRRGIRRRGRTGRRRTRARRHHAGHRAGCRPPTSRPTSSSATPTSGSARRAARRSPRSRPRALAELTPLTAGWYSGTDPWTSCYGPTCTSPRTRAASTSPPPGTPGPARRRRSGSPPRSTPRRCAPTRSGLANAFRQRLGLGARPTARSSTWPDADGADLAALAAAGITASGRAGRARVAFHVWNDDEDVDLAATALGR